MVSWNECSFESLETGDLSKAGGDGSSVTKRQVEAVLLLTET